MGGSSSLPERIGGYRVLAALGEGGMGSVLKAAAPDGRTVAVKVVRSEYASHAAFRARFRREAAAAARVPRFCTAEVLDFDVDGPAPFIVTEFIDGPTLHQSVRGGGPWQAADLEQLGVSVAAALTAIHSAGVVHRDLKPGNVLLSRSGPRVIDFGIARALDATAALTATGQPVGTPAFMAPEQYRGEEATTAVDVFAWGGLMVFAATGRHPFGTGPPATVAYRVLNEDPDLRQLEGRLRGVVEATMVKDPDARPDAQGLLALLGVRDAGADPLPAADRQLAGWVPPTVGARATPERNGETAQPAASRVPAAPAMRTSTAVQTPPPVHAQAAGQDAAAELDLDLDLDPDADLDPDGPATAEMPPIQELHAPRPANRPPPGVAASGLARPDLPETAAGGGPPGGTAGRGSRRSSIGRTLLVVGVLVGLAALGIYGVAGLLLRDTGGSDADRNPVAAPPAETENYNLAIGAAVTTGSPAPGAGELATVNEHEVYAFEGIKGQKLYLTASSCEPTNGNDAFDPSWSLTDPSGQRLGLGTLCADANADTELPTLPVNGRYKLAFKTDGHSTGRFSFLLSAPPELPGEPDGGIPPTPEQLENAEPTADDEPQGAGPAGPAGPAGDPPSFRGRAGHYADSVELLRFLDGNEARRVYLDVTLPESAAEVQPEDGTLSSTLFSLYDASCTPAPAGQTPSVDDCASGVAVHSVTIMGEPADSQLSYASGTWHLKGYFAVHGLAGVRMGEMTRTLEPIPLIEATG